jgi:putative membrane protein
MSRVSRLSLYAALVVLLTISIAAAQDSTNASMSGGGSATKASAGTAMTDAKFVKEAAEGGMAEVALGQLAAEKASSSDVKQFGQRMVDDHTKANDELKQLASRKKIAIPQELNAKDKATKARLDKLSGEQFDQAYMKDMVMDHKKDVSDFRRESKSARDPDIKNFATKTLPTLEDHLKHAESISSQGTSSAAKQ